MLQFSGTSRLVSSTYFINMFILDIWCIDISARGADCGRYVYFFSALFRVFELIYCSMLLMLGYSIGFGSLVLASVIDFSTDVSDHKWKAC